mmetsp:Transcript_5789/g.18565  ORF Transcript_5789/g.18565 Transcript_5789/m.18565 type:complete len:243 (-) Transcript_5789:435-1163(-)
MPGADMKDPAAHGLHLNRPLASATRICPGSQSAHCPACLAAGVQSEQAEAPAADARPAGQGMQASPPAEYQVAGHSLQNPHPTQSPAPCPPVAAAPAAEGSNPGLHVARQLSREGDAKVPDGQAEQLVPGTAEKLRVCGEGGALSFTPSAFSQIIPHPASWDTHVPAPQTAQAGWSDASGPVESPCARDRFSSLKPFRIQPALGGGVKWQGVQRGGRSTKFITPRWTSCLDVYVVGVCILLE